MLRAFLLLVLMWAVVNQLSILAILVFLWYLGRYTGYELVLLAILIDGYYGAFYEVPWLSLWVFGLFVVVSVTKEKLLLYTQRDEIVS